MSDTETAPRVAADVYSCSSCGCYHAGWACPWCGGRNEDYSPAEGETPRICLACSRGVLVYCDPGGMP